MHIAITAHLKEQVQDLRRIEDFAADGTAQIAQVGHARLARHVSAGQRRRSLVSARLVEAHRALHFIGPGFQLRDSVAVRELRV